MVLKSKYPPNGFSVIATNTHSARQVERRGLAVQKEMPKPAYDDPKTGMEYFVHFPARQRLSEQSGRDAGRPGLKKSPDLNRDYEEPRGPPQGVPRRQDYANLKTASSRAVAFRHQ
jgi:hypothetical protein